MHPARGMPRPRCPEVADPDHAETGDRPENVRL